MMFNFISGIIFGIIAATIGFGSIANTFDHLMSNLKQTSSEFNHSHSDQK